MKWDVPEELSEAEQKFVLRLRRGGKFYIFLREIRSRLFDESFQAELEQAYGTARGTRPLPPALLAMVTLLQAYEQASDSDAVEHGTADLRWQLPLGCLGAEKAPFSQGVLSQFRERMAEHNLDKKLLERTVQMARETGKFGWKNLKVALDSSPLLGAGRVEDTWNLIGRALSTVVDCAATSLRVPRERVLREAKLTLLSGPSLKAALDIDWDDDEEKAAALQRLLAEADALQAWVQQHAGREAEKPPLQQALVALRRVLEQDLDPDPSGGGGRLIHRGAQAKRGRVGGQVQPASRVPGAGPVIRSGYHDHVRLAAVQQRQ